MKSGHHGASDTNVTKCEIILMTYTPPEAIAAYKNPSKKPPSTFKGARKPAI
jgi:hypothetical protein